MAFRAGAPRGRPASKRLTDWLGFSIGENSFATTGGTIIASLNAAALAKRPFTVVRTYIAWQMVSDQAAAIEEQFGALGLCVVTDQAAALGVTAVPTPSTDIGSDLWFAHAVLMGTESNLTDRTRDGSRGVLQSKGMRRVNPDEDLLIVAEFSNTGGGFVLATGGRILVKLH